MKRILLLMLECVAGLAASAVFLEVMSLLIVAVAYVLGGDALSVQSGVVLAAVYLAVGIATVLIARMYAIQFQRVKKWPTQRTCGWWFLIGLALIPGLGVVLDAAGVDFAGRSLVHLSQTYFYAPFVLPFLGALHGLWSERRRSRASARASS